MTSSGPREATTRPAAAPVSTESQMQLLGTCLEVQVQLIVERGSCVLIVFLRGMSKSSQTRQNAATHTTSCVSGTDRSPLSVGARRLKMFTPACCQSDLAMRLQPLLGHDWTAGAIVVVDVVESADAHVLSLTASTTRCNETPRQLPPLFGL